MVIDTYRMSNYNETYSDRNHKYTINLPKALLEKARAKAIDAGFGELAPYLRAIIAREVTTGTLVLSDILGEKEIKQREYAARTIEEARRESKTIKRIVKKILDLIKPRQYTLW